MTILMSDLRGFTARPRLAPREARELSHRYLSMVDVISRHEGTIDEIIGDAILVIFGAPCGLWRPCCEGRRLWTRCNSL